MCVDPGTAMMVGAAVQGLSALQQGQAKQAQYETEAAVARNNQTIANNAADDALRRGELEAQRVQRQGMQLVGTQRAGYAAKGLDITEGTPGDVIDQTNFFAQADSATARYNGRVEAWQKRSQANNFGAQASAASTRAGSAVTSSLLSAAGSVAPAWYGYKKTSSKPVYEDD